MENIAFVMLVAQSLALFLIFSLQDSTHQNTATSASIIVGCLTPYSVLENTIAVDLLIKPTSAALVMILIAVFLVSVHTFLHNA